MPVDDEGEWVSEECADVDCVSLDDQILTLEEELRYINEEAIPAEAAAYQQVRTDIDSAASDGGVDAIYDEGEVAGKITQTESLMAAQEAEHQTLLEAKEASEAWVEQILAAIEEHEGALSDLRIDRDRILEALQHSYPQGVDEEEEAQRVAELEAELIAVETSMASIEAALSVQYGLLDEAQAEVETNREDADAAYRVWQVFDNWRVAYETMEALIPEFAAIRARVSNFQTRQMAIDGELQPLRTTYDKCCGDDDGGGEDIEPEPPDEDFD